MNTPISNEQAQTPAGSGQDFARRNPLEVGRQLRNLASRGDFLTVQFKGGQVATRIFDVNTRERTFVFDVSALPVQNRGLLAAPRCLFQGAPDGVRVEFATTTPRATQFDGRPAFEVAFPDELLYVQRREFFRVRAPVAEPYICRGHLRSGAGFRFPVHDLSLGGIGVRTRDVRATQIPAGSMLENVELVLNQHGTLLLDLELVSHCATGLPGGAHVYRLGFRYPSLPARAENTLQRLVNQLEMKRSAFARE